MATQIPDWLTGAGVIAIVITPLTVANDGTFTVGTTQSLTGHLDEITLEQYNQLENITPLDSRQDNEVIVASGTNLNLYEILSRANGNFLSLVGNGTDYVQAGFSRGGKSFAGTFVVRSYKESLRRGKSVGILSLSPCGIGVAYI